MDKEREREKEKGSLMKDDDMASASSKRRRLKRDHLSGGEMGTNFGPVPPPLMTGPALPYDGRDRDRKGGSVPARGAPYLEDVPYESKGPSSGRGHGKESTKVTRREHDQYPLQTGLYVSTSLSILNTYLIPTPLKIEQIIVFLHASSIRS